MWLDEFGEFVEVLNGLCGLGYWNGAVFKESHCNLTDRYRLRGKNVVVTAL